MKSKLIVMIAAAGLSAAALAQTVPANPATPDPAGTSKAGARQSAQNSTQRSGSTAQHPRNDSNPDDRGTNNLNDCTNENSSVTNASCNGTRNPDTTAARKADPSPKRDKRDVKP